MRQADEERLLGYLEAPKASEHDDFAEFASRVLMSRKPELVRRVKGYRVPVPANWVVDRALHIAFAKLVEQHKGQESLRNRDDAPNDDEFERYHDLCESFLRDRNGNPLHIPDFARNYDSLVKWIMGIIGRPYAGVHAGIVTNEIRRHKDDVPIDDDVTSMLASEDSPQADLIIKEYRREIKAALSGLPARETFVLRIWYGWHPHPYLTPNRLKRIAKESGYDDRDQRNQIAEIAQGRGINESVQTNTLDQETIAALVGVKPRQLRNLLNKSHRDLQAALADVEFA